jgi:SAM-dependent methyltransferase
LKPYHDHFSTVAAPYASCRPQYPEQLFHYLAGVVPGHELAWDCAAGSGQATIPLARVFRRVMATDASAAMLAQAPPHPNVEYRVAPAHTSGLDSASADLVTVAQALHWLELEPFYAEVERVLVPDGVLAVWSYGNQTVDQGPLDRILQRFYRDVVGPYWAPERRHVESGYRTLPFPYAELSAPQFVMRQDWTLLELLGYIGTWSATEGFRQVMGRDPVEELGRQLRPLWGEPSLRRPIQWALSLRAGRKAT